MFRRAQAAKQLFKSNQASFSTRNTFKSYGFSKLVAGGVAVAAATAYMHQQRTALPAFFQMESPAACAAAYKVPNDAQVAALRAELTEFVKARRNMAPLLVRLSWHDAGTFDAKKNHGGPRGCMRVAGGEAEHGANAGLQIAVDLLQPVCDKHPHFSVADVWSLAACLAIECMNGPVISWRPGRKDARGIDSAPDGRLPDATQGCPHLRDVFHRMGFTDQDIVALSGAHAIGMCHGDRSGFIGPWTVTPLEMNNDFFVNLVNMKWEKTTQPNGLDVFVTKDQPGIIMLPTDVDLLRDEKMVQWVEVYAKDQKRWEQDFAHSFCKLQELGVPAFHKGAPYKF